MLTNVNADSGATYSTGLSQSITGLGKVIQSLKHSHSANFDTCGIMMSVHQQIELSNGTTTGFISQFARSIH